MKRIVIDARESGTSTGRYIDKLVKYLNYFNVSEQVVILTRAERLEYFAENAPKFTVIETPFKEFTFSEQIGFRKQLNGLEADLVHFGATQQPILYRGKSVTTVHDLTTARFRNPDKQPVIFWIKQQVYKFVIHTVARKSAAIMTPSQFVKDDLVKFARVSPEKVTVTHEAADAIDSPATPLPDLQNKQFIMYIGRPTPHKNLPRLIDAFVQLQKDHPSLWLVLAGKKDANYRRIEADVVARGIKQVLFTDFITEGELRWLYEHTGAYVFPSLSEGFGLPGLEAMMHGAPVVSSNATCLPEIYGESAHYFDPLDVNDMANKINDVLTDSALRKELIKKGSRQAATYSWKRMAEQTLAIYRSVLR